MATNPPLSNSKVVSADTFNNQSRIVKSVKTDISSGANITYNVATLLGVDAAKYDLTKTMVVVDVLDSEAGSITYNYYVSAIAAAAVGWKDTGEVIVTNQHQSTQNFYIRIIAFLKPVG